MFIIIVASIVGIIGVSIGVVIGFVIAYFKYKNKRDPIERKFIP